MYLENPDITKPVFKIFPEAREDVLNRRCPFCKKIVNTGTCFNEKYHPDTLSSPFRDDKSRKEYKISGLCQNCQDDIFGK